jgi:hypothetical protein
MSDSRRKKTVSSMSSTTTINNVPPDIKVVVRIEDLEHLKIPKDELRLIMSDLDERRLVDFSDEGSDITATGLRFVEARHRDPLRRGDNYTMNIGNVEGGVQQGPNKVQNINITNHQPISEILPHLLELIEL